MKSIPSATPGLNTSAGSLSPFIVLFLGLQLGMSSVEKILTPEETEYGVLAFCVLGASILIKLWQCFFYRRWAGKFNQRPSTLPPATAGTMWIATAVVLLGALLTRLTGVNLDGFLGLAVAVFYCGFRREADYGNRRPPAGDGSGRGAGALYLREDFDLSRG